MVYRVPHKIIQAPFLLTLTAYKSLKKVAVVKLHDKLFSLRFETLVDVIIL